MALYKFTYLLGVEILPHDTEAERMQKFYLSVSHASSQSTVE